MHSDEIAEIALGQVPGEVFQYNNSGYHLLGEVIESVSGITYTQFLTENILEPLELQHTGFASNVPDTMVNGYLYQDGNFVAQPILESEAAGPYSAGGMISTPTDLLAWVNAIFDFSLLSQSAVEKMVTPFRSGYALGWQTQHENNRLRYYHLGALFGHAASVSYYPENDLSIIVLSNVNDRSNGGDVEIIAKSIEYLIFEDDVMLQSERIQIELPESELSVGSDLAN